ncbi:MAG TPA: FimV/HubP family polar landmark protein, partial [Pseudomonadales bacterium]
DYDDFEADALVAASPAPADGAAAYAATQDSADRLRAERDPDMTSLDDALDGVDNEHKGEHADAFESLAETGRIDAIAADAGEALTPLAAEEQTHDADYAMTAADAAFAAVDDEVEAAEVIEFTMPAVEPDAVDPPVAEDDDVAETFEFTLKDLPETESPVPAADASNDAIETFDFRLNTPVPEASQERAAPSEVAPLEVIAFPGAASTPASTAAQGDDLPFELGDLSFDDTTLIDDEEESPYKPRTGNECDTKLDLATAYEAMGDVAEAIEILDEVIAEGSPVQIETAQRLKDNWQASL